MGRKLDLTGLTEDEAEHVLQVVQRDMSLRKKEEERLSELRQELDDEGSRCSLLSRQHRFNERCCIRCCSPFTFLLNPRRQCLDCQYNVCRNCCSYTKKDKAWVCSSCQKGRLLKTQSLEWYYNNIKCRFKRFGSAKVLKTLYRKHLVEQGTLGELTEGSTYEESIGTEGSVCSDSAFYRQSEEHSMADTHRVALRVAEEAIDEAITKAQGHTDSQDKQSEAMYLQEHKEELIGELATTIVQKIIRRRKNQAEMKPDHDLDWPPDNQSDDEPLASSSPSSQGPSTLTTAGRAKASLWRSRSAFSLLDDNNVMQCSGISQDSQKGLDKGALAGLASWRSVDRLDNSILKSPDGNWIALQSTQLSRPSLLTKRKSLLFSVLEKESGVTSAYDQMGSDDPEGSEGAWGAALLEIRRKMSSNTNNNQGSEATDLVSSDQKASVPSPSLGRHVCNEALKSDFNVQGGQGEGQGLKPKKSLFSFLKRKMGGEHLHVSSPRRSSRPGIFEINFNPEGAQLEAESSGADELEEKSVVRKSRRRKRSKKEHREERGEQCSNVLPEALAKKQSMKKNNQSGAFTPDTQTSDGSLTSGALTPDTGAPEGDAPGPEAPGGQGDVTKGLSFPLEEELTARLREVARQEQLLSTGKEPDQSGPDQGEIRGGGVLEEEMLWQMEVEMEGDKDSDEEGRTGEREGDGGDLKSTLIKLASQARGTEFSSTEDELDRVGLGEEVESEEDREEGEEGQLTAQLCMLASKVSQFSSTEDELDRAGLSDGETDDRTGANEELTFKLCRLARQVGAAQFSSTEDELDRMGLDNDDDDDDEEMEGKGEKGGREGGWMDTEALWEMEGDKEEMTSKLRDLASLVSASQFSSTEDELDRVGEEEREEENRGRSQGDRGKLPNMGAECVGEVEIGKMWNRGRQGEVELVRTKPWYLGVMMAAEGRMMNQERKDSMGELDARLFDFEDESGREGEESNLEGVMHIQRMMEEIKLKEEEPQAEQRKCGSRGWKEEEGRR
ncbi:hypothetical protein UPYG_G00297400 [Umbra pygmaea]|uniref:RabBD domain-containing protein n=1 Tax=Umbra pygmaea TaxID=75934 RepID=A0ABD0W6S4_UMBPY